MEREMGTIYAIKALGYSRDDCVRQCRCDELPCPLLTWLVSELRRTCPELQDRKAGVVLVEELRALLTDLFCPYSVSTTDTLSPALLNKVTEFLVSELHAARILQYWELHPEVKNNGAETEKEQRVEDHNILDAKWCQEYKENGEVDDGGIRREDAEKELALLFQALDMDVSSQLTHACPQVETRLALLPGQSMTEPLLDNNLSSEQWTQVEKIHKALLKDYECRLQMMSKRFQVTLQSFTWGEKEKERSEVLASVLASVPSISSLPLVSQVSLSLLLAARQDQSCILPVKAGPSTAIYKVLMGSVPDRGGRPGEIEPPMPSWEKRREGGGRGRGGHGGGRGGGGRRQKRQNSSGKKRNETKE